jgi:hypothetical protein
MERSFRAVLLVFSVILIVLALGFSLQIPSITRIWPMPNTSPLSFIFIGSIFAAAAAAILWCLFAGENGSLVGVALDFLVTFIPLAIYTFMIANGNSHIMWFGIFLILAVVLGVVMLLWARRYPVENPLPQPLLIRISYMLFTLALLIFGGLMVLQVPNILPWRVTPEGSVIYGWMFLGAAAFFIYSIVRRTWADSGAPLAGFLAYDIVLIVPFIDQFSRVDTQLLPNLILYTAVVIYSTLLAIYYLLINKETRISLSRPSSLPASGAAS